MSSHCHRLPFTCDTKSDHHQRQLLTEQKPSGNLGTNSHRIPFQSEKIAYDQFRLSWGSSARRSPRVSVSLMFHLNPVICYLSPSIHVRCLHHMDSSRHPLTKKGLPEIISRLSSVPHPTLKSKRAQLKCQYDSFTVDGFLLTRCPHFIQKARSFKCATVALVTIFF
ncbi:hypothetical protein CSKR_108963 [Clonorchis sinensis]|uniref:Uncharacterized protein n=1 Tax=Clonorchis sinensis TaxID=79923 RepID=A0A419PQH5_CLOSI|nr:hypothetical protein CSKR_108963 [Clonorchis sinensis]